MYLVERDEKISEIKTQIEILNYTHQPKSDARNSPVWQTFHTINDVDGYEIEGFYYCTGCDTIEYSPRHGGSTTQLLRHKCVTVTKSDVRFDTADFDELKRAAAKFICSNLQSFRALECPGLRDIVMAGVRLGKKNPKMSMDDLSFIFPSRNTVKSVVESEAQLAKESIRSLFRKVIDQSGGFGCTFDMWTDKIKHNSYLAMTANMFFANDHNIEQRRLVFHMGCIEELVKSRDVIRSRIIEVFKDYGVSEKEIKECVTFTTDR